MDKQAGGPAGDRKSVNIHGKLMLALLMPFS
jgi:hypothetical protein